MSPFHLHATSSESSLDYTRPQLRKMAKRPDHALHTLYARRRSRPTSRADGPGYLYAFVDHGHLWKLGMTNNFDRRKAEWDRRCPSPDRRWMPPIAVKRRRRADLDFAAFDAGEPMLRSSGFLPNAASYGGELSCRYFLGLRGREVILCGFSPVEDAHNCAFLRPMLEGHLRTMATVALDCQTPTPATVID
ncbi:hypothetical protein F5880DRAFT_1617551 [Lentinula raphanica]|nr:hypothetical protein F5880DRAFT_1617551 [Lentinula raphanica]